MRRIALAVPAAAALVLSGCGGSETAAPAAEPTATATVSATASASATTPPPEEIAAVRAQEGPTYVNPADVQITKCADVPEYGPAAKLLVTNRDTIPRSYYIYVLFSDGQGVRYEETPVLVTDVLPGETVEKEASGGYDSKPGVTCRLGEALTAPAAYSVPPGFWKLQVGG